MHEVYHSQSKGSQSQYLVQVLSNAGDVALARFVSRTDLDQTHASRLAMLATESDLVRARLLANLGEYIDLSVSELIKEKIYPDVITKDASIDEMATGLRNLIFTGAANE